MTFAGKYSENWIILYIRAKPSFGGRIKPDDNHSENHSAPARGRERVVLVMLHCVFSSSLECSKSWYALNPEVCGVVPRKFSCGRFFQVYPDETKKVRVDELTTRNGDPVPTNWFFGDSSKARVDEVYVASTIGLLGGLFSRRDEVNALSFPVVQKAIEAINKLDVENLERNDGRDELQAELRRSKATLLATKRQMLKRREKKEREVGMTNMKSYFIE